MSYAVDTTSPVLVTGATGYIAGVLIRELLQRGVTVHATVRDPSKKDRLRYLQDVADSSPGKIQFFEGDLNEPGSFAKAMQECSIVFHTASPFQMEVNDPVKDLIEPAVQGTVNVLTECSNTPTVLRVVLTSSAAAIYTDASECTTNGPLNEETWNRTASLHYQPYSLSKTLAEQKAWTIAGGQKQWDMVTINPTFVLGPGLICQPTSTSYSVVKQMAGGEMASGCADFGMGVVDVREVAMAHIAAAYLPDAKGRYIVCGHNTSMWDASQAIRSKYHGELPLATRKLPFLPLWLLGPYLGPLDRRLIWNNLNVKVNFDNSKSRNELGIKYRPLEETMTEMVAQMIKAGELTPSSRPNGRRMSVAVPP